IWQQLENLRVDTGSTFLCRPGILKLRLKLVGSLGQSLLLFLLPLQLSFSANSLGVLLFLRLVLLAPIKRFAISRVLVECISRCLIGFILLRRNATIHLTSNGNRSTLFLSG